MKQQFVRGLRAGVPVVLGYIPVGIAYALMARQAGFSAAETCAMSFFVYAGASQMMAAGMYAQGAGVLAIVLATFILNLRHFIMSTCVANRMGPGETRKKLLAAFGVTDETFAVFTTGPRENATVPCFLGLALSSWASWNVGTLAGALISDILPPIVTASLAVSLYAMFIAILIPGLSGNWRLGALVMLTAVCNTVLTRVMPSSWALIVSTLVCAFAGVFFVELEPESGEEAEHA